MSKLLIALTLTSQVVLAAAPASPQIAAASGSASNAKQAALDCGSTDMICIITGGVHRG